MPIINVQILEGRPQEQIKDAIQSITESASTSLGVPKERVRVLVTEVPKTHWGTGGVVKADE